MCRSRSRGLSGDIYQTLELFFLDVYTVVVHKKKGVLIPDIPC